MKKLHHYIDDELKGAKSD